MDDWGCEHLALWRSGRLELPAGPLFCLVDGPTAGRPWRQTGARVQLRRLAVQAGVRRRFAPHQLRHAHAVEMAREGVPLNVIQRQLGHRNLGVTKPGGRVVLIAYRSPAEFEALQVFVSALKVVAPEFPGLPDDPPPLEFQVADPEVLRRRLTDAGLKDIRSERTAERPRFSSGQEMWDWMLYSNPITGMVVADLNLTEDQQARLRQILDGMLRERAGRDRQTTLTNGVNIGIGTK